MDMTAVNDITGDVLRSKTSAAYRNNYDAIFGKKETKESTVQEGTVKEEVKTDDKE